VPATAKTLIMDAAKHDREGVLMLESDPSGAAVFVDGTRVGVTPIPDHELKFGVHEVRLEAPDCEPASIFVEMRPERPLRALSLTLAPLLPTDGSLRAGQFVAFGPDVVPPCRVSGSLPAYPPGARERGLAGAPVVEVWVGEHGEVMDVAIVESAGALLDGALLDAVSQWRFTPARTRGVPVSVRITIQHHFRP
jgi:TonB family protein